MRHQWPRGTRDDQHRTIVRYCVLGHEIDRLDCVTLALEGVTEIAETIRIVGFGGIGLALATREAYGFTGRGGELDQTVGQRLLGHVGDIRALAIITTILDMSGV